MKNNTDLCNKRVAALLSGGVDSSVAVATLVSQGVRPDLWYIQIGPERDTTDFTCTIEEDLEMARAVAAKYGLPLQVIDLHEDYWNKVVDYTIERVRRGLTPNPDVMCNRLIKFGVFDERVGHDYDVIATGHYATTEIEEIEETDNAKSLNCKSSNRQIITSQSSNAKSLNCKSSNRQIITSQSSNDKSLNCKSSNRQITWLCTSPDPVKDQTDFLAQLMPWQLQKACFPIGHMSKAEVRAIAEREHLVTAHRKDSQGICFLGQIDYNDYIRKYLGEKPGQVIDQATGRVLGVHRGLWFHTIGQRKGLGFSGGPWYVVRKDMNRNILFVANGFDTAEQYSDTFSTSDFHALTINPFTEVGHAYSCTIKIRHTPLFTNATVTPQSDGSLCIHTAQPLQGVAPGQFAVLYDSARHRCYGSGEIAI